MIQPLPDIGTFLQRNGWLTPWGSVQPVDYTPQAIAQAAHIEGFDAPGSDFMVLAIAATQSPAVARTRINEASAELAALGVMPGDIGTLTERWSTIVTLFVMLPAQNTMTHTGPAAVEPATVPHVADLLQDIAAKIDSLPARIAAALRAGGGPG